MPKPRKREDELQRPRSRQGGDQPAVSKGQLWPTKKPQAGANWHSVAKRIWESFDSSGQVEFWQNSDWAFAFWICDQISDYQNSARRSAQQMDTLVRATERLLLTEADRRKARIELQHPSLEEEEDASVTAVADYKARLEVVKSTEETA